jgi:hypothetical protein
MPFGVFFIYHCFPCFDFFLLLDFLAWISSFHVSGNVLAFCFCSWLRALEQQRWRFENIIPFFFSCLCFVWFRYI